MSLARSRMSALALACLLPALAGCQAGVMIGRILFGDPLVQPALTQVTGLELIEGTHTVHLACTAPASVVNTYDALELDLVSEVSRRLKRQGIPVTKPDDVAETIDDLGGRLDPRELAEQFDDGLLVHVNLERFSLAESDGIERAGDELHRGRALGEVVAYEIRPDDDERGGGVIEIYRQELRLEYPTTHPIPRDQMSAAMFEQKFLGRLADEVGRRLYPFRVSDTF